MRMPEDHFVDGPRSGVRVGPATTAAVWAIGLVAMAGFLVLLLAPTPPWP